MVGVLALQGAFREHLEVLDSLGVISREVRSVDDLKTIDKLIIPGGETTAMEKILSSNKLQEPIKEKIREGLPVLGTCAGLILLGKGHCLGSMDIRVKRNAYGRQLGSFRTAGTFKGYQKVPMVFIRAPYIESVGKRVEVLSKVDDHIVAAQMKNILVVSFHPELTTDKRIHQYFLNDVK